jgi:hypothetical protein
MDGIKRMGSEESPTGGREKRRVASSRYFYTSIIIIHLARKKRTD